MTAHMKVDTRDLGLPSGAPISNSKDGKPGSYSRIALVLTEASTTHDADSDERKELFFLNRGRERSIAPTQPVATGVAWADYEGKDKFAMPEDRDAELRDQTHEDEERYNGRAGFYIRFEPASGRGALSAEAALLYKRVKRAERFLNNLEITSSQRRDYVLWLVRIARFGLQGENCCPHDALTKMDIFEHEMKAPLKEHRDAFIEKTVGLNARMIVVWLSVLFLALAGDAYQPVSNAFGQLLAQVPGSDLTVVRSMIYAFLLGLLGLAVGEVFTVIVHGRVPQYEKFFDNPRYRYDEATRWVFVAATWTVVMSLASSGAFAIDFNGVTFGDIVASPGQAVVLAVLTSIGFQHVVTSLTRRREQQTT